MAVARGDAQVWGNPFGCRFRGLGFGFWVFGFLGFWVYGAHVFVLLGSESSDQAQTSNLIKPLVAQALLVLNPKP